jgi:hypothetical protein
VRKKVLTGLLILLLVLGIFAGAALALEYSYYKVSILSIGDKTAYVNETETTLDVAPYIKSGRTLVPLRFMESALGAEIKWDPATRSATLKTSGTEVHVTIDKKMAHVNGKEVTLDIAAEIKGGRTFVPLRFVSENLGADVEYDADTRTIIITYVNTSDWKKFTETANNLVIMYPGNWTVVSSDKNNLKLQTPNASVLEFKTETKDLAGVIKDKKDGHSKDGWEVLADEPIDEAAPNDGHMIGALKSTTDPEKMEVYAAYIFKAGTTIYAWEFTGTIAKGETDHELFEYIYNNI